MTTLPTTSTIRTTTRRRGPDHVRSDPLAAGCHLPEMRQDRHRSAPWRRIDGAGLVLAQRLPVQVHGARRIGFGAQPYPNAQMDARLPAVRVVKERLRRAPANADGQPRPPPLGVVHGAPHPRGDGRGRSGAAARRREPGRRGGRDVLWRQGADVNWRYVNGVGWVREKIDRMIVLTLVERGGVPGRSTSMRRPSPRLRLHRSQHLAPQHARDR